MLEPSRRCRVHGQSGAIVLETALVLGVLVLFVTLLIDIRYAFDEQVRLQGVADFSVGVAATAGDNSDEQDQELLSYIEAAIQRSFETAGLDPALYLSDIWPAEIEADGHVQHYVQITVSRNPDSHGRFYLLPEGLIDSCFESVRLVESRRRFPRGGGAIQNPECNPAGFSLPSGGAP